MPNAMNDEYRTAKQHQREQDALREAQHLAQLAIDMIRVALVQGRWQQEEQDRLLNSDKTGKGKDGAPTASSLHEELATLRKLDRQAETMALLGGLPVSGGRFAHEADVQSVGFSFDSATPKSISRLQNEGFGVMLYNLNDARSIEVARQSHPDGMISDNRELI